MRSAVLSLGLMLLIVGCTGQRYGSSKTAEGVANQQHTTAPAGSELQGLRVNVALSDKAKKKLIESKETVIVAGYFTGTPKQGALKKYLDEMGEIDLGKVEAEVAPGDSARFGAVKLEPDAVAQIDNQGPLLLINVFSGRKSSENNLLDCGIYEGAFKAVQGRIIDITCKLIGE